MTDIEIAAVAVALAMDAFAVSIATGVRLRTPTKRQTFRLAWHFGLFQGLMPLLGWSAGIYVHQFIEAFDHWIAFGLLLFISFQMAIGAFRADGDKEEDELDETSSAKNGTHEPTRGLSLIILSMATSIDALAVGLSLAMLGVSVWYPALVIGLVALAFTAIGIQIGGFIGRRIGLSRYAALVGAGVLAFIGLRILHEHGVF
ncbi:MAG: manganese efflux pump MntP family protein [Planctomycetota bacterium]|nr:manganese efflux pump MntP family protein [Planctomycetota bacterium]